MATHVKPIYLAAFAVMKENATAITDFRMLKKENTPVPQLGVYDPETAHDLGVWLQDQYTDRRVGGYQLLFSEKDLYVPVTPRIFFDAGGVNPRYVSGKVHGPEPLIPVFKEAAEDKTALIQTRLGDLFAFYASDIVLQDFGGSIDGTGTGAHSKTGQRYACIYPRLFDVLHYPEFYYADATVNGQNEASIRLQNRQYHNGDQQQRRNLVQDAVKPL